MTREEFWEMIDGARAAAMFVRADLPARLHEELVELDESDVVDFARHFHECRLEAFKWELWAAAWIAGGGASDADFSDFRDWLITMGREMYDAALHNSESLVDEADELGDPYDSDVGHVALDVYRELTGEAGFPPGTLREPPREPGGRKWRPEDLPRRFPRLWQAFNPDE